MPVTVTSFNTPVGTLLPVVNGGHYTAPFEVSATFARGSGAACPPAVYRQHVCGTYTANGSVLTQVLDSPFTLWPDLFLDDGCPAERCVALGHGPFPGGPLECCHAGPDDDCRLVRADAPGFANIRVGVTYTVMLDYRGVLCDPVTEYELREHRWSVLGSTRLLGKVARPTGIGLAPTDTIVGVHRTRNLATRAREVHVIVVRPLGQPPLHPAALTLHLYDLAYARIGPLPMPEVYEVVGGGGATVNVVYTLPPAAQVPVAASLAQRGRSSVLPVRPHWGAEAT